MIVNSQQNLNVGGIRYDRISMSVNLATSPTNKIIANVLLTPMRVNEDGVVILAPPEYAKTFRSSDLDAMSLENPGIAALMGPLQALLQDIATALEV